MELPGATAQPGQRTYGTLVEIVISFIMPPQQAIAIKDVRRDHNPRAKRGDCDLAGCFLDDFEKKAASPAENAPPEDI
jgi:hypothetical protein